MSTAEQPRQQDLSFYPGMRPREGQVWRLWLRQHEAEYDRFEYNVRVGPGLELGEGFSPAVKRTALLSTQKRMDVVAWRGAQPTLIEVKGFAQQDAIGQILQYAVLWGQSNAGGPTAALRIVCSASDVGVQTSAAAVNIAVDIVAQP